MSVVNHGSENEPWLHLSSGGRDNTGLKIYRENNTLSVKAWIGGKTRRLSYVLSYPAERLFDVHYNGTRLSLWENGERKATVAAAGGFDGLPDRLELGPKQGLRELLIYNEADLRNRKRTARYLLSRHALPIKGSTPPYAAGLALRSQEISEISAYQWPTHAAVPWPRGTVRGRYFRPGIFENGKEIPSQELDAQTWDRHGVDLRWSHIHFIWNKGRHYTVRGMSRSIPVPSPAHPIKVTDGATRITVETGKLKMVLDKRRFALFDEIRFDPTGKGNYVRQILSGSFGAEILDNGTTFATRFDPNPTVAVEVQGPLYVVITAEGVYQDAGKTGIDWANFTTRIHFWADQEWIRIVHNLGYREDMATHAGAPWSGYDHAVIRMPFNFAERFAFAADDDGAARKDDFTTSCGADLYLHQEKHDSYRFGTADHLTAHKPDATGTRSNNCWAIQSATDEVRVECYLRNGWQEFPFEAKVGQSEMGVSMQPWHGYEAFGALTSLAHTGEQHIHKLRYAHTGQTQRQGLPYEYVEALFRGRSYRR